MLPPHTIVRRLLCCLPHDIHVQGPILQDLHAKDPGDNVTWRLCVHHVRGQDAGILADVTVHVETEGGGQGGQGGGQVGGVCCHGDSVHGEGEVVGCRTSTDGGGGG